MTAAIGDSRRGDQGLANLRLAIARHSRIPDAGRWPLRLAEAKRRLADGLTANEVLGCLDFDDVHDGLAKFDPEQLRVPAGSERGRWTSNQSGGSTPITLASASGPQTKSSGFREVPYLSVRDTLATLVRGDLMRDEMGGEEADAGYKITGMSGDRRQLFAFHGTAGGIYPWPCWNRLFFFTNSGRTPDPTIVTYRFAKAVTLAAIAAWEPAFCLTGCSDMEPKPEDGWYYKAWITWVPPAHAASLDLVIVPFAERAPDGGLLLSATEDVFDASNAAHVDGARRIQEALRPLNATLPSLV